MSDDSKHDSGSVAAVSEMNSAIARRDSQTSRRNTGLKLVTIAPAESEGMAAPRPAEAAPDPYVGCTIDNRYIVEGILGEGGMGVVYRCRHKIIDKKVAMKVLRADLARDPEVTERFLIEAKAASAIGSEHIIDISDFGQLPDGATYFVMEFLEGQSLSNLLEGERHVPVERLIPIARQLAEGLLAAHVAGIVHRDLKPDNIYLVPRRGDPDFVKILDFGIAKVSTGAAGKLTRAGSVFGTPHYMSPEQAAGESVDHRGDIYALGVILYELAAGRVPFDADNFMGILTQHMYKAPVPLRALVSPPQEISPGLEAIILKCMSKRPEERYDDMKALMDDIDRMVSGQPPTAVREMMDRSGGFSVPSDYFRRGESGAKPKPRTPLVVGLAGVGLALALGAVFFLSRGGEAPVPVEPVAAAPPPAVAAPPPAPVVEPVADDLVITTQVILGAQPMDAHVYRGEEDLGASPVVVDVPEGEIVTLVVRREGYASKTVKLDGRERKVAITLEAVKSPTAAAPVRRAPAAAPAPKNTAQPAKPKFGGDVVDPWAK
jgi:eukaryotic-like serine/threonine-protein kinase